MLSKRKDKKINFVHTSKEKTEYDLPEATPEKLNSIREKLQEENKKRYVKLGIAIGVIFVTLVTLLLYLNITV